MGLRDFTRTMQLPMRVWDAPIRLFHWAIVLAVLLSYLSARAGWMRVHLVSGETVLALLAFRLAWGFVGSDTARFGQFLASPADALRQLAAFRQRGPDTQVGHNAACGWMALLMLALLAVQAVSGLLNADRHGSAGPLARYAGERVNAIAGTVHGTNFTLLAAAAGLHVLAILAYALVKRHDLVRPMITGVKRLPATTRQPHMASPILAATLATLAAMAVGLLATLG
jgi:cytochrome b